MHMSVSVFAMMRDVCIDFCINVKLMFSCSGVISCAFLLHFRCAFNKLFFIFPVCLKPS